MKICAQTKIASSNPPRPCRHGNSFAVPIGTGPSAFINRFPACFKLVFLPVPMRSDRLQKSNPSGCNLEDGPHQQVLSSRRTGASFGRIGYLPHAPADIGLNR